MLAVQPRLAATLAASPAEATDSAPAKSGSKTTAKPAPAPEPEPPAVPEDPAALAAFASLFGEGAAPAAPAVSDTDSFWEQAADQQLAKVNPDTISFDQAVQLGLAPDEPDKEK